MDKDLIQQAREKIQKFSLNDSSLERTITGYLFTTVYPALELMNKIVYKDITSLPPIKKKEYSLYIHIPFCSRHCTYCNFSTVNNLSLKTKYIEGIKRNLTKWTEILGEKIRVNSIYIGGETPTSLDAKELSDLLNYVYTHVSINEESEITLETHPEIITKKKDYKKYVTELKKMGVNRVSVGVQSFDNRELKLINRGHTSEHAKKTINLLKSIGFDTINIDLMYCLPSQTVESWERSLNKAYSLKPDSITTYRLEFKKTAPIFKEFKKNPAHFFFNQQHLMNLTSMLLAQKNGYHQTPIGWFTKIDKSEPCHQKNKWSIEKPDLLPLGVSAYGYINGIQFYNLPILEDYLTKLEKNKLPIWKGIKLEKKEIATRAIIFGIKAGKIDKNEIENHFSINFDNKYGGLIKKLLSLGLIENNPNFISLTEKGILFNEEIALLFSSSRYKKDIIKVNYDHIDNLVERYRQTCILNNKSYKTFYNLDNFPNNFKST